MKNILECRDFWMEVIVPVLLGQETPTNEQVCVWEEGEKGDEVLNSVTNCHIPINGEIPGKFMFWWNNSEIFTPYK